MLLAGSILGINNKLELEELKNSGIDFLHLDVMDNVFVNNYSLPSNTISDYNFTLDIHLMVKDVQKYVEYYKDLKPEYITFHYEVGNTLKLIELLKQNNIKVGLAISPKTTVTDILPYLDKIDLVLIMSVEPGYGGQEFIKSSIDKVNYLNDYRKNKTLDYLIQIDGGINDENIDKLNVDIAVIGSYITTSSNYKDQVRKLGKK